jgi:protein transport protein SEC23
MPLKTKVPINSCLLPQGRIWVCPFCYQRSHFPQHYSGISEQNLPAELYSTYSTVEYSLAAPNSGPPAFLFVVDTCQPEEDLQGVRDALTQALSLLPESSLVGLVTFGTMVQVGRGHFWNQKMEDAGGKK